MDKKYKILLLLLLGLVILYLIWRLFLRRNNPKGNSSLDDVFFGLEKYETPKEYQILHNLAKNSTPEPLDLGIKEYKREPVPKKLYRTWCTSDPEGICGGRKADIDALNSTQKAIPDWEQIIYGDKEIDNFLEKEFGKNHKVTKAYNLINPKYGAARADLFRYLIIYKYGGFYLDMKSCVSGPIPEMPKDKDMWVSGWGAKQQGHLFPEKGEYQNWYIYARKGAPVMKEIIERVVHNIYRLHENPHNNINMADISFKNLGGTETKSKGNVLSTTGPIAMTIAILNSNQINTVQDDISINNVLDYYCIKDDCIGRKDHYSQQTEPLIFLKKDTNHIPKVVYMTYHDINSIPPYVFNNINKYCSGYEVKIYNDNMCLEFLEKYYGKEAVEIFNNMENGAHKADFWRYCILYVFGGYYFDIKTDFQTHINNIFDSKKEKTWYTVICSDNSCLFNGIIVTPPRNPVILDAIKHIYNNPKPSDYLDYVRELLIIVNKNCRNKVKVGENEQKDGWNCILFQEKCDGNCGNNCDRWGVDCIIVDKEGKKVFNTRYKDFPWKSQSIENYVDSQKTYISMTTIPERLKDDWFLTNLKRTIGLLENNQILIINIPKFSLKGEQYIIPDVMNAMQGKNFIIHHCEKDEGPITKLLPSLRNNEIKDDDIIIVCDDDIVYKEDVFKLLEKSVMDNRNDVSSMCYEFIQGFKGFAFVKKTLKPILNIKITESCQRIDDDVIGWYIDKNNIRKIEVSYKGNNEWHCSMYKEETDTHPNWNELVSDDRESMIKMCLKDLNNIKEEYSPSRAQFGQDLWALEYHNHKRDGTYLEIGVHDGEKENNTVMMDQEYGWRGVCIDPMMKNMEKRSCQQFNVALGSEPGEADFRYGDGSFDKGDQGLSGLDKFATSDDNKQWKDAVSNFKIKKVQVRTPEDVFKEANLPSTIDYMSLDVEGAEMDILRSFPFDKYCVKYATIETNNDKEKEKEMEEFMTQRGYKFEGHKEIDHIFSNTC
jgi:FkbM family methyltransferase